MTIGVFYDRRCIGGLMEKKRTAKEQMLLEAFDQLVGRELTRSRARLRKAWLNGPGHALIALTEHIESFKELRAKVAAIMAESIGLPPDAQKKLKQIMDGLTAGEPHDCDNPNCPIHGKRQADSPLN